MKIKLLEDTVDGDVQDGSINMEEELNTILRDFSHSRIGHQTKEVGELFETEEITKGRIDVRFDETEKEIRWYVIGYYKTEEPVKRFEFSNKVLANAYRYLVKYMLTNYPQIESYISLLDQYRIYAYDFDLFTESGIISGKYFFDDNPTFKANFDAKWPLNVYLRDVDEIALSYVLPHDITFDPKFVSEHYRLVKRTHQLAKLFQKGRFQDHDYKFEYYRVMISPSHKAYDNEKKVMVPKIYTAISYYRLSIDGANVDDKIIPMYDQANKGTNFETIYQEALISELKKRLKNFGIESVN